MNYQLLNLMIYQIRNLKIQKLLKKIQIMMTMLKRQINKMLVKAKQSQNQNKKNLL